jgi:hypothetical protein
MLYLSPLTLRRACSTSLVVGHMAGTGCPLSRYVWRTKPLSSSFIVYRCSDFHPLFARSGRDSGASATSLRARVKVGLVRRPVRRTRDQSQFPNSLPATMYTSVSLFCLLDAGMYWQIQYERVYSELECFRSS